MSNVSLYNEDCLDRMPKIADHSVDLILCDLPYGTTQHKWDTIIPLDKLWAQYERILKEDGIICLFAAQPFTSILISSNLKLYKYNWIWKKETPTSFPNCHNAPMKYTEDICIFSRGGVGNGAKLPIRYNPQGLVEVNWTRTNKPNDTYRASQGNLSKNNMLMNGKDFVQQCTNYPNNILEFSRDKERFHPTQKPVALLEYLIKTYTQPGETVLDNCMGGGSTGVACVNLNRDFIGIELDSNYYNKAVSRINKRIEALSSSEE